MAFFINIAVNAGNDICAVDLTIEADSAGAAVVTAERAMVQLGFPIGQFEIIGVTDMGGRPGDQAAAQATMDRFFPNPKGAK